VNRRLQGALPTQSAPPLLVTERLGTIVLGFPARDNPSLLFKSSAPTGFSFRKMRRMVAQADMRVPRKLAVSRC